MAEEIESRMLYDKKTVEVNGYKMAYVDTGGDEDPIVFCHGNITSSYMWRNIMPHLEPMARCIAPDNIGQGDSGKLKDSGPNSYRLAEHQIYFDGLMKALGLDQMKNKVTFVMHDWGGSLGLTWAKNHPECVKAVCYIQTIMGDAKWDFWPPPVQELFKKFRTPGVGEELVLEDNYFVEKVLPANVIRDIPDDVFEEYRRPYKSPGEDRRPTLTWPREIPIEGEPADVIDIIEDYMKWLESTDIPKLHVEIDHEMILTGDILKRCKALSNQTEFTVKGLHYVHEDSPHEIGEGVAAWYKTFN